MRKINWKDITRFAPSEFPEDPDKYAEPELIYRANFYRIKSNRIIKPSPVSGALARFDGGDSEHVVKDNKKSSALDIFQEGIPIENFTLLFSLRLFNGVGIYLDTAGPDGRPWIMFHIDLRHVGYDYGIPLIWIAVKRHGETKYRYPQYESKYWKLLQDEKLYCYKKFGIGSS